MFVRDYPGSYHSQCMIDGTFDWDKFTRDDEYKKLTFTPEQVCKNWIRIGLWYEDYELVELLFKRLNMYDSLTLQEKIAYFTLLGVNSNG